MHPIDFILPSWFYNLLDIARHECSLVVVKGWNFDIKETAADLGMLKYLCISLKKLGQ